MYAKKVVPSVTLEGHGVGLVSISMTLSQQVNENPCRASALPAGTRICTTLASLLCISCYSFTAESTVASQRGSQAPC